MTMMELIDLMVSSNEGSVVIEQQQQRRLPTNDTDSIKSLDQNLNDVNDYDDDDGWIH